MTEYTAMERLQIVLEEGYNAEDMEKTRKALKDAESAGKLGNTAVGQKLVKILSKDMIDNEKVYQSDHYTSGASQLITGLLTTETVASMTASALIAGACAGTIRQEVVETLADGFIEVIVMERLKKEGPKVGKRIENRMEELSKVFTNNLGEKMAEALAYYATEYGVNLDADKDDFLKISQALLFKMADRSGFFSFVDAEEIDPLEKEEKYFQDVKCFEFSSKAHKEIENLKEFIIENTTKFRPMVCAPRPWTSLHNGGYMTKKYQGRTRLVKGHMTIAERAAYDSDLSQSENIHVLLNSLNAIQSTPFIVNADVLNLAKSIYDADKGVMGIPSRKPLTIPKKVKFSELKKAVKAEAGRKSKLNAAEATLDVAKRFVDYNEIYMPYNLDFRGRAYCVVPTLNPQGTDLQKAMLLFAKPCKLGKTGYRWLKIHAANCYGHGLDKAPKEERIAWVDKNTQFIKMVASGTIKKQTFRELMEDKDKAPEDPMLFYAVCKELAQLKTMSDSEIENFESRIPVSIDGSNNGLQHYAALLRNTVLAEKVNLHVLTDSDVPSDVYMKVAEGMLAYFKKNKSACSIEIAKKLKIDEVIVRKAISIVLKLESSKHRKLVKRSTMTQPYSVSDYGMLDQISGVVNDMFTTDKSNKEAVYVSDEKVHDNLSRVIFAGFKVGLATHCSAAKVGMEFLQTVAETKNDEIKWTTPSGFVARQRYERIKMLTVTSRVGKKKVKVMYAKNTGKLNERKQASAIAPNFVHSLDASHMMLTVDALLNESDFMPSFFMIHDSFGTYAGQLDALDAAIREQFVSMYNDNQFEKFVNQVELSDEQRASVTIPEFGDFNMQDVKKATYFFA